jgi:hypothetical protein
MKLGDVLWWGEDPGDDLLLDVAPVTVSVLVRGRNAWYSTWVRHWFHNSHVFSDHHSAQSGAEPLRGPGNVFYVNDVPALLLIGTKSQIAVIDGLRGEPFKHFSGIKAELVTSLYGSYYKGIFPGVTMREAVEGFQEGAEGWVKPGVNDQVRFGVLPEACILASLPHGRFASSVSFPQGSDYVLGWRGDRVSVGKAPCKEQAEGWRNLLEEVPGSLELLQGTDLVVDPKARTTLTRILKKHRTQRRKAVGSRDSLRREYERVLDRAEKAMLKAEKELDKLRAAEDKAQAELWDAEEFAEDPWSSLGNLRASSEAVRKVRERASNAQLLLEQARIRFDAVTEAATRAEHAWSDAQDHYYDLLSTPPEG